MRGIGLPTFSFLRGNAYFPPWLVYTKSCTSTVQFENMLSNYTERNTKKKYFEANFIDYLKKSATSAHQFFSIKVETSCIFHVFSIMS